MPKPGYTKSWRKDIESDVWQMGPMYFRVWHFLLQTVSWEANILPTKNFFGIHVNPGQGFYSIQEICDGCQWNENRKTKTPNKKTVLQILRWLEFHHQIVRFSNADGTFISICNWEKYQSRNNDEVTQRIPQWIPLRTHTKEVKEVKEEKIKRNIKEKVDLTRMRLDDVDFGKINPRITSETVKQFILHRKALKAALTQNALELTCSTAMKCSEAYGIDPNDAIMYGIERGWRSINVKWLARDFGKDEQPSRQGHGQGPHKPRMTPRQQYMDELADAINATRGTKNGKESSQPKTDRDDGNDSALVPVDPLS